MVYFGINIGSSNVCLTAYKDGNVQVVANDAGDRVTPACVSLTEDETLIGINAKQQLIRNPQSVITHIISTLDGCVNGNSPQKDCKVIVEGDDIIFEVICGGKTKSMKLIEVLKLIFKKLLGIAQNQIQGEDNTHNVVISVPQHFNKNQIDVIRKSATETGFYVMDTINRPTSATLAYGLGQNSLDDMKVLVYKVGGVATDVSIIEIKNGMYFPGENHHKSSLGGNFFTQLLLEYLLKEFQRVSRCDASDNKRAVAKLTINAENCKHVLSKMSTAHCFIESLCDGLDFSSNISRARYDSLISPHVSTYMDPIRTALQNSNLDIKSISKVVLCGGALKTPKLQKAVNNLFPDAEVLSSISPDEVIAHGAAIHAALIGEKSHLKEDDILTDVNAFDTSLYLKVAEADCDESYVKLLGSGVAVPTRCQQTFKTPKDSSTVRLDIYSKAEGTTTYNYLAKIVLKELPQKTEITLTVHVKSDGSVHISANAGKEGPSESVVVPVDLS